MTNGTPARLARSAAAACALAWMALGPAHPQDPPAPELPEAGDDVLGVLVMGRVTSNPHKEYPSIKRLAEFLAGRLADQGIITSRIQFAEDNETMMIFLREGIVDLIPEGVFSAIVFADQADAKLLLREWRDGAPEYHSVLFARRDRGITQPSDLVGKTIAFEDPNSTTAYFVPSADLKAEGFELVELSRPDQTPPAGAIGYVFAGSENNIVAWVHQGRVDAGAFSNIDWDQPPDLPPELKQDFAIFHRSEPLPRHLMVARSDLPPALEQRIKEVLLNAHEDPEGRAVLEDYKDVAKYDLLEGEAAAAIAAARRLLDATH